MKFTMVLMTLVLLAMPVLANQNGISVGQSNDADFQFIPADRDLIDAWNDDQVPITGVYYGRECFGFSYVPTQDYYLERIEWYVGDQGGTVSVEILDDGGEGEPVGNTLASVTYTETPPRGWQGADLDSAVPLSAGTQYWIVYWPTLGGMLSAAESGVIIPHWWLSEYGDYWEGPGSSLNHMARFYGYTSVPTAGSNWSALKSLY